MAIKVQSRWMHPNVRTLQCNAGRSPATSDGTLSCDVTLVQIRSQKLNRGLSAAIGAQPPLVLLSSRLLPSALWLAERRDFADLHLWKRYLNGTAGFSRARWLGYADRRQVSGGPGGVLEWVTVTQLVISRFELMYNF